MTDPETKRSRKPKQTPQPQASEPQPARTRRASSAKRSSQVHVDAQEPPSKDAAAARAEVSVEQRLQLLERAVLRLGQLCVMLAKSSVGPPMGTTPPAAAPLDGIQGTAPLRSLAAALDRSSPPALIVRVRADQIARVGLYRAGELLVSAVVVDGTAELHLPTSPMSEGTLELRGFDTSGGVVVAQLSL